MAKATKAFSTTEFAIPTVLQDRIITKMQEKSVVASLCTAEPSIFANEEYMVFSREPEAEFVGEGGAKSSSDFGFETKTAKPHKAQATIRMTQEVQWADEDGKTRILSTLLDSLSASMGRALDYGLLHGINPIDGAASALLANESLSSLVPAANKVAATTDPVADLDNLPDLILANYDVNGIALDRAFAAELRKVRVDATGLRLFPEIGLNLDPGSIDGIRSVTSDAVSGKRLAVAPTNIKAIIGDWSMIKWGMVRNFAVTVIPYGDPDGLGDLSRFNQIAYRAEAVFSWGILDPSAFAILNGAAAAAATGK